jgi:hypothetical protein
MVTHALDWGDSLNRCHRGGKIFATGREFFVPAQTHSGKAVKKAGTYLRH